MNSIFSEQILADKLSKLNSTQQCIETLSHWCIFHRTKAGLVVRTWDKQFHSSQIVQKVPLLYLANDILQNSKRKGNEFVNEFWIVLPSALKDIIEKGDDHGRNVVSRLVKIWEERRVFGSRQKSLRDVMLGEDPPSPLVLTKKRSRTVRILKRDSRSIRTKLSIGGSAEKIVSAYHSVLSENQIEDAEMNKCKSAVKRVRKMEKNVDAAFANLKDPSRKTLANALEEEENLLQQCIEKLRLVEANRVALVARLREALHEQESELENVRTQMQVAEAQVGEVRGTRKRLEDGQYVKRRSAADLAAEVADKLTASTSSQMIMSSVLSTFAAEEAKKATAADSSSNAAAFLSTQQQQQQYHHQPTISMPTQPPQYHLLHTTPPPPPPPSQPSSYLQQQQSTATVNPFGYGGSMAQGAASMVPVNQLQMPHQQTQPPAPPSFRPLHLPPVLYYNHPHHSQ